MITMSPITRRQALRASALGGFLMLGGSIVACTTQAFTPAQLIADGQGMLMQLYSPATATSPATGALPGIAAALPGKISAATLTKVEADIVVGENALAALAIATTPAPTGATVLAQVEGYINEALDVVGTIAVLIPAPYGTIITAITVLLPVLESFVNSVVPTLAAKTAALRAAAVAPTMTPAQARAALGIPTV
jgi:hypothetical protein